MNDLLFFKMHNPTGMINQVMSVELAVGLAHETNRSIIMNYISNSGDRLNSFRVPIYTPNQLYNPQRSNFCSTDQFPSIFDLLDVPVDMILIDEDINKFPQEHLSYSNIMTDYYYSNSDVVSDNELSFAEGRTKLFLEEGKNVHLKNTLGWYSRFFFNRSQALDLQLSKVKFKKEYQDFADMVAESLGDFQGIHLRLSDHRKVMFEAKEITYIEGLNSLEKNGLPIVICTDEPSDPMVQNNKYRTILLDEYIVNEFGNQFKQLTFSDEITFGLISMLVMEKSKYFIGTSGSTYTAYIQRKRNQQSLSMPWEFLDNPNKSHSGPYSWNNYDLDQMKKMFWREWDESKLNY